MSDSRATMICLNREFSHCLEYFNPPLADILGLATQKKKQRPAGFFFGEIVVPNVIVS